MWHLSRIFVLFPLIFLSCDCQIEGLLGNMRSPGVTGLSALLVVAWSAMMNGVGAAEDVEKHMEMGNRMLAAGQLADALSHYHAAVESDPTNYRVFFRRATVYLAMGKSKSALPDLDRVIELKPDFTSARVQRANVKLKQGKLDEAHIDYEQALQREPQNEDAMAMLMEIEPLKQEIEDAYIAFEDNDWHTAIDLLQHPIERCPWDPELHELRATCYENIGDYLKAVQDIRPTNKLRPDNTAGYYRISTLYYTMGEADESLNEIRECLKLDPDHKECFPHYKKVKKLVKQMNSIHDFRNEGRWEDCLNKVEAMKKTESEVKAYATRAREHQCHCYSKSGQFKEAVDACTEVIAATNNNIDALCDRAEAYILNEMYEEGVDDYKKAQEVAGDMKKVNDGLKRAEKLLKQSKKRDYYKILGVKRNASKKEIKDAYRGLAKIWHPDMHESEEDKKKAEKKFFDIAAAKEVLSDPDMRHLFDNGEDPLDAEEKAERERNHHNPFRGHRQQGGFNQGFKFHFG